MMNIEKNVSIYIFMKIFACNVKIKAFIMAFVFIKGESEYD